MLLTTFIGTEGGFGTEFANSVPLEDKLLFILN
jgi:hypothetical protein